MNLTKILGPGRPLIENRWGKNMANLKYEIGSNNARAESVTTRADMKLEVVVISVSDVDRAKKFYGKLGWRLVATYPRTFERRSQCNRQL